MLDSTDIETGVGQWPPTESIIPVDPSIESRIDGLLERLSLERKVGQLIQGEIQHTTPDDVFRFGLGSVLSGGGSFPGNKRHATHHDWRELAREFHRASMRTDEGRIPVPVFWGVDAVHGHNNVRGATVFPHNIGLGAANNMDLVAKIARCTASEMYATGVRCNFSPSVSVAHDFRWGRTYESYSTNPQHVGEYARTMVTGLQNNTDGLLFGEETVMATLKHFIGDGGTEGGMDRGETSLDEATLRDRHGLPYFSGIAAGAQLVMASFSSWNGEAVHGSHYLLTRVLKEQIGFDGIIISDWNGHSFVPGCSKVSCAPVFNAGVDIVMVPQDWHGLLENTISDVEAGLISMERIDDAVRRVLRVKFRAGLFEDEWPEQEIEVAAGNFGSAEHHAVAVQAVQESLVLLKNKNALLPVSSGQHVLVAGDAASNLEKQMGGWSLTWQGRDVSPGDFPHAKTILQGIKDRVEVAGGKVSYSADGEIDCEPDVAVVVFGEQPYAEWHGDRDTLEFEADAKSWGGKDLLHQRPALDMIRSFKSRSIPVISICLCGRPLFVNPEINASDAFVVAWQPGSAGEGVALPIFESPGENELIDFKGRLPFDWPDRPIPSETDGVSFPHGFGLSLGDNCDLDDLPEPAIAQTPGLRPLNIFTRGFSEPWSTMLEVNQNQHRVLPGAGVRSVGDREVIRIETGDRDIQEDSWLISWNGNGEASFLVGAGIALNLEMFRNAGASLCFDVLADDTGSSDIFVGMGSTQKPFAGFSLQEYVNQASNTWQAVQIPLSRFESAGVNLSSVLYPLVLRSDSASSLWVNSVRIALTS